jgi:hypothetical protein
MGVKMKFEIKRFSYVSDEYDNDITAEEIELMLNKIEQEVYANTFARWEVKKC